MFEDKSELDHVMHLVRAYADLGPRRLSPGDEATVRANSVVIVLQEKLRAALIASGIPEHDLADAHHLYRLTDLQQAYAQALRSVRASPAPSDWSDKKIGELERQLLAIHAIKGDSARDAVDSAKQARQAGGEAGTDDATLLLRDMGLAYQEQHGKWPTARKLVDWMKAKGYIEQVVDTDNRSNLRLKDADGRSAIILDDMTIIGNRLRNIKRAKKT